MPNSQRRPWVALDQWKADARAEKASADVALRKGFAGVFKAEGDAPNAPIRIRISTAQRDRSKDTVNPAGWRLDAYLANPVVLWAHDYHAFPIAKDTGLTLDANGLVGSPQFATADENPWAPYCEKLIRGGFLNAASVGFAPLKWLWNEEERGVDFQEQELLEYSIVPVPDNPGALVEAKAQGIEIGWIAEWAEKALDEWHGAPGLWVPRAAIEQARKIVKGSGLVMLVPGRDAKALDVVSLKSEDAEDEEEAKRRKEEEEDAEAKRREEEEGEEEEGETEEEVEVDDEDEDEEDEVLEVDEEEDDEEKAIDIDAAELREVVKGVLNESLGPALTALTGRID